MSLEQINEMELAQEVTDRLHERMLLEWTDTTNTDDNLHILTQFNQIAAQAIHGQGQIAIPGNAQAIPLTAALLEQAVNLFGESIYHSLVKFHEFGVPHEIKLHILQVGLAAHLLEQSQVTVATTFGQEHTPDFQVTPEQQVDLMQQTAENAMLYFINEYEKQHGPIHPPSLSPDAPASPPAMAPTPPVMPDAPVTTTTEPPLPIEPTPAPVQPVLAPKGPTPHDKYAAVALLLGSLPSSQRSNLLRHFNAEEKELITYYSLPQHIEHNLDLSYVDGHLKRFKTMLKQDAPTLRSRASREIESMAQEIPAKVLLSWVKYERPLIHSYLAQCLGSKHWDKEDEPRHLRGALPARVEEVLCQYLVRQRAS